jgi:hypothetical protein
VGESSETLSGRKVLYPLPVPVLLGVSFTLRCRVPTSALVLSNKASGNHVSRAFHAPALMPRSPHELFLQITLPSSAAVDIHSDHNGPLDDSAWVFRLIKPKISEPSSSHHIPRLPAQRSCQNHSARGLAQSKPRPAKCRAKDGPLIGVSLTLSS